MLSGEKEGFLEKLQELGVVDITRSVKPIDEQSSQMLEKATAAKRALDILDKCDYSKDPDFGKIEAEAAKLKDTVSRETMVDFVERQNESLKDLKTSIDAANRELTERLPWGEFDKASIDRLESAGYDMVYYCTDKKSFSQEWQEQYPIQVIQDNGKKIWFVAVVAKGETCDIKATPCKAPAGSYKDSEARILELREEVIRTKAGLLKVSERKDVLADARNEEMVALDRYFANVASDSAAENMVAVMTGFAPKEAEAELCAEFDKMDIFYMKEDAVEDDNPPIKLKNNWFTKQFEVLTGMYGMPVYSEFDPTPILAPFYLLFFSMCMGDAGYGLVLILFGLAVKKGWIKIGMFEGLGNIISILGVGTLIVGTVMGTFFGIPLMEKAWVPEWLKGIMITGKVGTMDIQMILAIAIGVFHICLAMVIKAICYTKRFGFRENFSTWGWLLLILGGLTVTALAFTDVISSEITQWAVIVIGVVSALGIYVFNKPGRNPLINIGAGLWDTYNMATGLMGDVLSYVRLYALGLAGGMLGKAFNDLGYMVLGDNALTWVPFVLILLFGHVLNVAMSALGAFVHPLRLTFVEYFKNAGYEGKGAAYNPLKKQINKQN